MAREVGTEGVLGGQAKVAGVSGVWRELTENVNSMANNLTGQVRNIAEVVTAIAQGDLRHKITVDARGRDPHAQEHHQRHGRQAEPLRRRGDPGGPPGRHRGHAGRAGRRQGRVGHLEGADRQRQPDGPQPDRSGARHRRRHHRRRQRRPVEEDHRRGQGRDPAAQEHHQRRWSRRCPRSRRGDPHGARGRHRGRARRPGGGARRLGRLAGAHPERELDGQQPDQPGAQHRRGGPRRGRTATCRGRSPSAPAARCSS